MNTPGVITSCKQLYNICTCRHVYEQCSKGRQLSWSVLKKIRQSDFVEIHKQAHTVSYSRTNINDAITYGSLLHRPENMKHHVIKHQSSKNDVHRLLSPLHNQGRQLFHTSSRMRKANEGDKIEAKLETESVSKSKTKKKEETDGKSKKKVGLEPDSKSKTKKEKKESVMENVKGSINETENIKREENLMKTVNPMTKEEIEAIKPFLLKNDFLVKLGHTAIITQCPRAKPEDGDSLVNSLYINNETGQFVCHYCNKKGPWKAFEQTIQSNMSDKEENVLRKVKEGQTCFKDSDPRLENLSVDNSEPMVEFNKGLSMDQLSYEDVYNIKETFDCQCIETSTFLAHNVRFDKDSNSLLFPYYSMQPKPAKRGLVAVKRLTAKTEENGSSLGLVEKFIQSDPPISSLFGWKKLVGDRSKLILMSSELDVLSVRQEAIQGVCSLPTGLSALPTEILPHLENFKKILFWFGNDTNVWHMARKVAVHLGENRCSILWPSENVPSALGAAQKGISRRKMLQQCKPFQQKSIITFSNMKEQIKSDIINVEATKGIQWGRFPTLNQVLKGHRAGEMTVFTGQTGSGKTTFISEYSLDLCMEGVNTLWGSFEINNVKLGRKMLTQFAKKNLQHNMGEFDDWYTKFQKLPMYFMTFFGQENVENVIETATHAVYAHDIKHVVIDNLQFMMGVDASGLEKFHNQDRIVGMLRQFATSRNCHVTIIIHPRKEKDEELSMLSIAGSAKAIQEADNVLILKEKRTTMRSRKYIDIVKNRFDGEVGVMSLRFDSDSLTFSTPPPKPKAIKKPVDNSLNQGDTAKSAYDIDTNDDTEEGLMFIRN